MNDSEKIKELRKLHWRTEEKSASVLGEKNDWEFLRKAQKIYKDFYDEFLVIMNS